MNQPTSWKKAAAMAAGVILVGSADLLGVRDSTIALMAGLISAYILGQGAADWGKNAKGPA